MVQLSVGVAVWFLSGHLGLGYSSQIQTEPSTLIPEVDAALITSFPEELRGPFDELYAQAQDRPEDAEVLGRLGMLLQAYEQFRPAELFYRRATGLQPQSEAWWYYLGVVQIHTGDNRQAVHFFERALENRPESVLIRLKLTEALLGAGEAAEASQVAEALKSERPDLPQVHYLAGRAAATLGDTQTAAQDLKEACRLFPRFGAAHYALALVFRDLGMSEEARTHLQIYQRHTLDWPPLEDPYLEAVDRLRQTAQRLLRDAARLGEAQRLDESIQAHLMALEKNPDLLQAHVNLISAYGRIGEPEKAERHYQETLRLNPRHTEAHYNYGVLLMNREHYLEAGKAFQKALESNPYHAPSLNNLGVLLLQEGQLEEAESYFRRALENDPTDRTTRFNLGRVRAAKGAYPDAVQEFLKILTPQDEATPRYLYALSAAYVRSGDLKEGLIRAEEALALAERMGLEDLASSIRRDLERLRSQQ